MKLGQLLNVSNLLDQMSKRFITIQRHPTLPLAILNYTNECMLDNYWSEEVQLCRGLVIGAVAGHMPCDDCDIVARPMHKFFNLNQTDETKENYLATLGEPTITEKMDGWFGIMWSIEWEGQTHYGVASRGSFTSPGALYATAKLQKLVKYGAVSEFPVGYSPIFEIISKETKIVVEYPFEGLVLLGCVNIQTGEELSYDELQAVWAKIAGYAADNRPWIRLVKAHRMSIEDCLLSDKKNFEGFVASYPRPGTWAIKAKIKLDDYKRLHRLITGITPQQIWTALYDPLAPWFQDGVPDHFKVWATTWRDRLYADFHRHYRKAANLAGSFSKDQIFDKGHRKSLMESFQQADVEHAAIAMDLVDGKIYEAHKTIWRRIRPMGREEVFYREGQGE